MELDTFKILGSFCEVVWIFLEIVGYFLGGAGYFFFFDEVKMKHFVFFREF